MADMSEFRRVMFQRRALTALLLAPALAVPTALAQGDAAGAYQGQLVLEEVIVTARKREEVLQDTPVAVTAFSTEALRVAGIANTRDLQQSVPGLIFSEMGNKSPSIFI